jgi:hypothetical protein
MRTGWEMTSFEKVLFITATTLVAGGFVALAVACWTPAP